MAAWVRALLLLHLDGIATAAQEAEHRERVDAEDPAGNQRDRDGADADAAAADEAAASAAPTAPVFDVVRLFVAFPSHRSLLAGQLCRSVAGWYFVRAGAL